MSLRHTLIADDGTLADLLRTILEGQGASKAAMVELRGIEPLTFSMRMRVGLFAQVREHTRRSW